MVRRKVPKRKKEKDTTKRWTTSKKDFEFFQKEFLQWVVRLGLTDWEIYFEHKSIDSEARVDLFWPDKIAKVAVCTWWDHEVTEQYIKESARHEAIHLCLGPLDHLSRDRFVTEGELDMASEDITRRICVGIGALVE